LSKVTLLVLKLLRLVVFVMNCSWSIFFYFWKPGLAHATLALTWQKSNDSNPGLLNFPPVYLDLV